MTATANALAAALTTGRNVEARCAMLSRSETMKSGCTEAARRIGSWQTANLDQVYGEVLTASWWFVHESSSYAQNLHGPLFAGGVK